MRWNLAHRPTGTEEATFVDIEADSSHAAITTLRALIPPDHKILFVRRVYDNAEDPAVDSG